MALWSRFRGRGRNVVKQNESNNWERDHSTYFALHSILFEHLELAFKRNMTFSARHVILRCSYQRWANNNRWTKCARVFRKFSYIRIYSSSYKLLFITPRLSQKIALMHTVRCRVSNWKVIKTLNVLHCVPLFFPSDRDKIKQMSGNSLSNR